MKVVWLLIFLLFSNFVFSQIYVNGTIVDSKTNTPLAFCNISVKDTGNGTITNNDGVFRIKVKSGEEILEISYLGYEKYTVKASAIKQSEIIKLEKKGFILQEILISANNDYIYDIISNCQKKLTANKYKGTSKVYYSVESETKDQPLEIVECFYNADINNININDLHFRNGRIGISQVDSFFFFTLNTSQIIKKLDLHDSNSKFPYNPLQFKKNAMKKNFDLRMINANNDYYHILFIPQAKSSVYFSGEIWIEKETYNLLKINLTIEKTNSHPFITLIPYDYISDVSFTISNTYKIYEGNIVPDYFDFNYSLIYHMVRDSVLGKKDDVIARTISSKSLMYFYDYNDPFIIPFFEYNDGVNDYVKMSIIPYNEVFWDNNNVFLLSNVQKEKLNFFEKEGYTYNYKKSDLDENFFNRIGVNDYIVNFIDLNYVLWSKQNRLSINKDLFAGLPLTRLSSHEFKLSAQILLDILVLPDSLYFTSFVFYDRNESYYNLKCNPNTTNTFLNIFFDICEIERHKMELLLRDKNLTIKQIEQIYKTANKNIDEMTKLYFNEVNLGENVLKLTKWNMYVKKNLGIDNMAIFELSSKESEDIN